MIKSLYTSVRMSLLSTALYMLSGLFLIAGCASGPDSGEPLSERPLLFPDYADVTIPPNIAPLSFRVEDSCARIRALFSGSDSYSFSVNGLSTISIPDKEWKRLLSANVGGKITVRLLLQKGSTWYEAPSFSFSVSPDSIDSHLAYRLIPPGYEMWKHMGIYQRSLSSFRETAVMENRQTDGGCMNCHSFSSHNPKRMSFHLRAKFGGTLFISGDTVQKVDLKSPEAISAGVYTSWHPGGRYVAFSLNKTFQKFHMSKEKVTEVYDEASDLVVYDTQTQTLFTDSLLYSAFRLETHPSFSPDGRYLYFCTASSDGMPDSLLKVRYSICRIAFDAASGEFGQQVDTVVSSDVIQRSAVFPRISPDGRFLVFTAFDYGQFPIWHPEADLWMVDLSADGTPFRMTNINSDNTESYHSWSSNGRWMVFSSRRIDGLYTRLFLAHIDDRGEASKPFLLPQSDPGHNDSRMQSYNIPEFVRGEVEISPRRLGRVARSEPAPVYFEPPR